MPRHATNHKPGLKPVSVTEGYRSACWHRGAMPVGMDCFASDPTMRHSACPEEITASHPMFRQVMEDRARARKGTAQPGGRA